MIGQSNLKFMWGLGLFQWYPLSKILPCSFEKNDLASKNNGCLSRWPRFISGHWGWVGSNCHLQQLIQGILNHLLACKGICIYVPYTLRDIHTHPNLKEKTLYSMHNKTQLTEFHHTKALLHQEILWGYKAYIHWIAERSPLHWYRS